MRENKQRWGRNCRGSSLGGGRSRERSRDDMIGEAERHTGGTSSLNELMCAYMHACVCACMCEMSIHT